MWLTSASSRNARTFLLLLPVAPEDPALLLRACGDAISSDGPLFGASALILDVPFSLVSTLPQRSNNSAALGGCDHGSLKKLPTMRVWTRPSPISIDSSLRGGSSPSPMSPSSYIALDSTLDSSDASACSFAECMSGLACWVSKYVLLKLTELDDEDIMYVSPCAKYSHATLTFLLSAWIHQTTG